MRSATAWGLFDIGQFGTVAGLQLVTITSAGQVSGRPPERLRPSFVV